MDHDATIASRYFYPNAPPSRGAPSPPLPRTTSSSPPPPRPPCHRLTHPRPRRRRPPHHVLLSSPRSQCILLPCSPIAAPATYSPIVTALRIAASATSARSGSFASTAASAAAAVPSVSYIASKRKERQSPDSTSTGAHAQKYCNFLRSLASMCP